MAPRVMVVRPAAAEASPEQAEGLRLLAVRLGLPLVSPDELSNLGACGPGSAEAAVFLLTFERGRLSLCMGGSKAPGAISVDFEAGTFDYRRRGNLRGESVVKAAGLKGPHVPSVIDTTAGLGQDAFILAAAGCEVQLIERSALLAALLEDGLRRALLSLDRNVAETARRMHLRIGDSRVWLASDELDQPDLVYLDPMFPERRKSARVKKEMFVLQQLLHGTSHEMPGNGVNEDSLLDLALEKARKRVVVKRPRLAACLDERRPDFQVSGKSSRFDVYLVHPRA